MNKLLIIIISLTLTSCLIQKELRISTKLDNSVEGLISITYTDKNYLIGEDINIDLTARDDIDSIYFEIVLNRNKFKLENIEKFGFSDEDFVMSKITNDGYEIIFSDLSGKQLNKNEKFATITFKSGWVGNEEIIFQSGNEITGE